jgi:hypothetical protein
MEAVTLAGIAVVVVGGYFSAVDFLQDIGMLAKKSQVKTREFSLSGRCIIPAQRGVKKMAGVNV